MEQASLDARIASLFLPGERGIFTCAAGYSHARYDQYTDMSQHIHGQMLQILDVCGVEYFLFAGSMVGYVRNRKMPYWMDDLDIIILEDNVRRFEDEALPVLRETGFNCFAPKPFPGGGYHLLSMQQGGNRSLKIPLSESKTVSVPWAQIDAFYTVVDNDGFIRNPAKWGLYHVKNVPIDWVRPGRIVEFGDLRVRAFSKLEADIRKEYGDVFNEIVIHSHSETFLRSHGVPWEDFEAQFLRFIETTSSPFPAGVAGEQVSDYAPDAGCTYTSGENESFSSICAGVIREGAGCVALRNGDQTFWVMDLKRLFPALKINATADTGLQAQRAAHLRRFVDAVRFTSGEAEAEHEKCTMGLHRILGY